MNLLFCSVGRRGELIKDFKLSMAEGSKIVATDLSCFAPALYFADRFYTVPPITAPRYLDELLAICEKEQIDAITTFIDPEIVFLSANKNAFSNKGVLVLAPELETAKICFDKFLMYQFAKKCEIATVRTFGNVKTFKEAYEVKEIEFPVFVKPRTGSGSVGAKKVYNLAELELAVKADQTLIIQEFMEGLDLDADVYIDSISHQAVSAFLKRKLSTTIGGANKTISFKDEKLFQVIQKICGCFEFSGPVDMDFFYRDGEYFLSEINPRFGGAYLHAYGAGVDFTKLIEKNIKKEINEPCFGDYDENVVMMMYDSVVIKKLQEME